MYCPTKWHSNVNNFYDLERLQQTWTSVFDKTANFNLPYKISFTGGELTANKHFLPFLAWLRKEYGEHIFKLLLTTNGSATYKYYLNLFEHVDNISFSTHSEQIDEQAFFDTVVKLQQNISKDKFLHVNIMNEFWNDHRIGLYKQILEENKISFNVNEIDYSLKTREYPVFRGNLNFGYQ
jgi:organic radical activating enzyme